jgi:hypothetical protein
MRQGCGPWRRCSVCPRDDRLGRGACRACLRNPCRPGPGLGGDLQAEACGISPAAGGVLHEAHEGLALPLREIREESNQVSEIGGHPKWSGIWSGIFLDCGISRGFCKNSTPPGGISVQPATAVSFANASGAAVLLSSCDSVRGRGLAGSHAPCRARTARTAVRGRCAARGTMRSCARPRPRGARPWGWANRRRPELYSPKQGKDQ